jgi:KTSC domain
MNIPMGSVVSDAVSKIGFSGGKDQSGTLRVQLSDGSTHDYPNTTYAKYKRFVLAKSQGSFYNRYIKLK